MIPVISVTGTKGKTSVVRALDFVLSPEYDNSVRVDTQGAWLKDNLVITHNDSKHLWGLAPANSPGRFMTLLAGKTGSCIAILEANLFSSKACGLGYSTHSVGVFTNVFEDHLGADKKLQTARDIAIAKSFVFTRVRDQGYAVFNADDPLIIEQLTRLPKKKTVYKVACSLRKHHKDLDADYSLYLNGTDVVLDHKGLEKPRVLGSITDFPLYVHGFEGSAYNVLLVLGALLGHGGGELSRMIVRRFMAYRPADEGGRLALYLTRNNVRIIFDYAHEKQSLKTIAQLAKKHASNGKVVGVLRLSPTRTDQLIVDTAKYIAKDYDNFVIYDKIDGVSRTPNASLNPFKTEKVGYTASIFAEALKDSGANAVDKVIVEEQAIEHASQLVAPGDTVVVIQGNDSTRSLELIHKFFGQDIERVA